MKKPELPKFTFGVDLDGVLKDRNKLKAKVALEMFGVWFDPNYFTRVHATRGVQVLLDQEVPEAVINSKYELLTTPQYDRLQNHIYTSGRLRQAEPVKGAREGLAKIRAVCDEAGLSLVVPCLTARRERTTKLGQAGLRDFEEFKEIDITSVRTKRVTKAEEAVSLGVEIFADDNLQHIADMGAIGIRAFLLNYGYNQNDATEGSG